MNLPKIVIPLSIQFSVRYAIRTGLLSALRQVSEPILLLGWNDVDLYNELEVVGCQCYPLPPAQMTARLARLRRKIQFAHFRSLKSDSISIDRRRYLLSLSGPAHMRALLQYALFDSLCLVPGNFSNWLQKECQWVFSDANFSEYISLIEKINPDCLFSVTPYLLEEELLIRAAASKNVKSIAAILSFDNLTTRTRIPVVFDKYLLWNEFNRQELLRIYPAVNPADIEVVGSPQFDFYYDPTYFWDETTWRNRLGIPVGRPVILFGAGPESITSVEPHIIEQLDTAIDQNRFPNKPIILLRFHPIDTPTRWEFLQQSTRHIIFDTPWQTGKETIGKTNVSRYDIEKLVSTLKYSQVHINTSSTMTIDGAIFDRPQIGPAYDDRPGKRYDRAMRELYLREHYLPITNSGGLQIAYSFEQLTNYIADAFQNPESHSDGRKKMIHALCTYNDGKSTQRVFRAVRKFLYENGLN